MQARERVCLRLACALAVVGVLFAAAPALAGATVRFASPAGLNSGDCTTEATACNLQRAVEVVATFADEVIVTPGTYNEVGDLQVDSSKYVHGVAGQPVPQLNFATAGSGAVLVADSALLARVSVYAVGGAPGGFALELGGATAEQVTVRSDGDSNSACRIVPPQALLRDSVCWSSLSAGTNGILVLGTGTATLRNVTAIATGPGSSGIWADALIGGDTAAVDADNVIADGAQADVRASAVGGGTAIVVLEHSNYATEDEIGPGMSSVTDPGSATNQTSPPHFVSAGAGNFHQLPTSPTIDAGGTSFLMGALDLDGQSRSVDGSASCFGDVPRPDIGADEFIPGALDCLSPETGINGGPKAKTRKRRASFNFVATEIATFQCSLDEKPFAPCTPPHVYRKLKPGKRVFAVRAVDAAGNVDTTPAERTWRIQGKKKRKKR